MAGASKQVYLSRTQSRKFEAIQLASADMIHMIEITPRQELERPIGNFFHDIFLQQERQQNFAETIFWLKPAWAGNNAPGGATIKRDLGSERW
jgi:hypothetical protein